MSIKAKLLVTISVAVALAIAVIGLVTVRVTRSQMIQRVDATLIALVGSSPREAPNRRFLPPIRYTKRATALAILAKDGSVQYAEPSGFSDRPDPLPDFDALIASGLDQHAGEIVTVGAADGSNRHFRVLIRPLPGGTYLAVAAPLDDVDATIWNLTVVIAVTGALVLAAVVLVVWLIISRGLRPIEDMIATAGRIADGDLSQRIEYEDTSTEVGQLGRALNAMLARIEASFAAKEASERRLRQFIADAAHELRTPLTSIRGYAELFRRGAASSPETLARVMARIESEGARMSKLVEDLLLLARLDQGRPLQREPVDLVQLVDDAVMDARAVEPDRPVSYEHPESAWVLGDADSLQQVIGNLLANARIHTPPGTPVHVTITASSDEITLTVADEGPGMAPQDAERAFDRFYRADPSRSRASGGAGLGLAIVAAIVEAHQGHVTLDTAPGQGVTVTVRLKRAEPPAGQALKLAATATTAAS